jgi:dTDP-4-amino-4,6-dideoxygalactose transaminase
MKVPFGSLTITDTAKAYVEKAIHDDKLSQGRFVRKLEEKFAEFAGAKYAIAVNSGTVAISIALSTQYDFGKVHTVNKRPERGDEVIVPALTFIASSNAILQAGFTPKFVDINLETLNINRSLINDSVTNKTIAMLPVHLMGKPVNMDETIKYGSYGIPVIEDCAEAHGATYKGHKVGTIGLAGTFSLYVAHIISSIEGGMIITNDTDVYLSALSLRNHGRLCDCVKCVINEKPRSCRMRSITKSNIDPRFIFPRIGYSAKMNELEAAIGLGTIEAAGQILNQRRENYYYYDKEFDRFQDYFITIKEGPDDEIGPHAYPIIVRENAPFTRDDFAFYLQMNGIDSRTLFGSIPTQSSGYKWMGHKLGEFPVAEFVGNNGLHIGVHQGIFKEHREYVIKIIEKFLKENV